MPVNKADISGDFFPSQGAQGLGELLAGHRDFIKRPKLLFHLASVSTTSFLTLAINGLCCFSGCFSHWLPGG